MLSIPAHDQTLIALSTGRNKRACSTSKLRRILERSGNARFPHRLWAIPQDPALLGHVAWWLAKPLSSRSSASSSVVPHLSHLRRYLHLPFRHRCRRSHCRGRSRILLRLQIQTRCGNLHQRSRRPRRHYRDLRHPHRHSRRDRRLEVQLQELLTTIECISAIMWV